MNIKNKLHYLFIRLNSKMLRTCVAVVLSMVMSVLMLLMIAYMTIPLYNSAQVKYVTGCEPEQVGILPVMLSESFMEDMMRLDSIQTVGCAALGYLYLDESDMNNTIWEICRTNCSEVRYFGERYIPEVVIGLYAFDLCNLSEQLYAGTIPDSNLLDKVTYPVYLGYNYRNIPLGSEIDLGGTKAIVCGIFKENTHMLYTDLYANSIGIQPGTVYSLDNMCAIIAEPDYYSRPIFFRPSDSVTMEEAEADIMELAQSYGVSDLMISTLEDSNSVKSNNCKSMRTFMLPMCVMGMFMVIVLYIVFQLLTVIAGGNELGIYMVNGMSKRDLAWMLIAENAVKYIFGLILATAGLLFYITKIYGYHLFEVKAIVESVMKYGLLPCIALSLLVIVLSAWVPVRLISQKTMSQLVRGKW